MHLDPVERTLWKCTLGKGVLDNVLLALIYVYIYICMSIYMYAHTYIHTHKRHRQTLVMGTAPIRKEACARVEPRCCRHLCHTPMRRHRVESRAKVSRTGSIELRGERAWRVESGE